MSVIIVWISFLSFLVVVGVLASIFSSKVGEEQIEDAQENQEVDKLPLKLNPIKSKKNHKPKYKKKLKPKSKAKPKKKTVKKKSKKNKVVKPKSPKTVKKKRVSRVKSTSKPKKKDDKSTKKPTKVSTKPVPKKPEPTPVPSVSPVKLTSPKPKNDTKNPKSEPKENKNIKKTPKIKVNKKPTPETKTTISVNGFTFNGEFDSEEISMVKKFAKSNVKNRGYVIQTYLDKVVLNKWIKTTPTYEKIKEEIKKKENIKGDYATYLIWYGQVTKTLLGSKLQ